MPAVHELGTRGRRALAEHDAMDVEPVTHLAETAHRQFAHSLMICEVLATLELAVRRDGASRFIAWPEILAKAPLATRTSAHPFRLAAGAPGQSAADRGRFLVPDGLFGLEYCHGDARSYRFFALETDRGTMPLSRTTEMQSSCVNKLLNYRNAIASGAHRLHWGVPNLLVLTVTTSEQRRTSIMAALDRLPVRSAFLLFATWTQRDSSSRFSADTTLPLQSWCRMGQSAMSIIRSDSR